MLSKTLTYVQDSYVSYVQESHDTVLMLAFIGFAVVFLIVIGIIAALTLKQP